MYETHPAFQQPSRETMIWRYMSFAKFVSLLEKKALFFARLDRLGDPFEGSPPRLDVELMVEQGAFSSLSQ